MINFLAVLGLHCSVWALCSCEQGCPPLPCAGLSFQRLLLLSITASRRRSFRSRSMLAWKLQLSGSRMLAQSLGPMDLFAPLLVESSQTRDWAHVPCIGRPILIHCATREVRKKTFLVLQYRTLKSTVVQHNGRHTGRASGGQASGGQAEELLTGRGSGGGSWSSATEMEGRLQFRSCLMLIAQVLVPCWIQFYLPSWTKDPVILGSSSFFFPPCHRWHSTTGLHSEQLLHSLYYFTFGSCALKINSISSNRTNFYWWLDMRIHVCIFHNLKVCVRRIYCIWMS